MTELIDVHMHLGYGGMTLDQLITHLDVHHVGRAVVLPIENPELKRLNIGGKNISSTRDVLEAVVEYPDRIIPYCHVDPTSENPLRCIEMYAEQGCRGFGEHKVLMPLDTPIMREIYKLCGSLGLPVMIHFWHHAGNFKVIYEIEEMLQAYPDTSFVAHSFSFWAGFTDPPSWPFTGKLCFGLTSRLLEEYPNFYGDLSGHSGVHTLALDREFSRDLLVRFRKKLMWGSDCCCKDGRGSGIGKPWCLAERGLKLLQELIPDTEVFEDIVHNNIVGLLGL